VRAGILRDTVEIDLDSVGGRAGVVGNLDRDQSLRESAARPESEPPPPE